MVLHKFASPVNSVSALCQTQVISLKNIIKKALR